MKKIFLILLFLTINIALIYSESIQDKVISKARTLIGTPYRMGGVTPAGFDCSGFILYLYKSHVPDLPRVSRDMAVKGVPVNLSSLLPGDLVFFATGSSRNHVTHVALYIGQNSIVHSISNGPERGVTVSSLTSGYWKKRYHNSSRILDIKKQSGVPEKIYTENASFAKGTYTGQLKSGEPHGKGSLMMKNGDSYKGTFYKGLFHGEGIYTWEDGTSFSGNFKSGDFSGNGVMILPGGEKIAGNWTGGSFKPETSEPESKIDAVKTASVENYMQKEDSPWNTYDGIVEGDFDLWFKKDMESFEEWKKKNQP